MTEEKELLTILDRDEYGRLEKFLRDNFGQPKIVKRLSLQSDNYDQTDVDTRIKITDGKPELIQKIGDWKNIIKGETRTEVTIPLQKDPETVLNLYKILRNLVKGTNVQDIVMQYESLIWETMEFEIKLTKQFGASVAYNCEVEVKKNSLSPLGVASQLTIPINPPGDSQEFWKDWNSRINLNADDLNDNELLGIISKYLK